MKIFKTKYRIVRDSYCGYEVQCCRWWWPFWVQCGFSNTHQSIGGAEQYITGHRAEVVKLID